MAPGAGSAQDATTRSGPGSRPVLLALAVALAAGALLRAPGLQADFRTDDHVQLALLEGDFPIQRGPGDLFWFGGRDAAENAVLRDAGYLPWWTSDGYRVAMLRPLASALFALDHRLFGNDPLGYHLHSLAWWALLLVAGAMVLSRLLPPPAAALGVLLYALDEAHTVPLAWVANRSTLIATALGLLALHEHVVRRPRGDPPPLRSALLLVAALGAGEYALALVGYFIAFELADGARPLRQRLRALSPTLALTAAYLAGRALGGHGVRDSGYYLSPFDQPGQYLARAAGRIGALAAELGPGLPSSWWLSGAPLRAAVLSSGRVDPALWRQLPSWHAVHAGLGAIALVALLWSLRWLRRRWPDDARAARTLLWGALLSLPLAATALPSSRLLTAASLGVSGLLGLLLLRGLQSLPRLSSAGGGGLRRAATLLLLASVLLLHGLLPAARARMASRTFRDHTRAERQQALQVPLREGDDALIVSSSDFTTAAHVPWVRRTAGMPGPRSYRRLSGAGLAHDLTRTADRTLELKVLGSDVSDAFAGSLYRPRTAPLRVGDRITVGAGRRRMQVTVLRVVDGNPLRLRFDFGRSLDDPSLVILHPGPNGLQPIPTLAVGQTVRLPRATAAWDRR